MINQNQKASAIVNLLILFTGMILGIVILPKYSPYVNFPAEFFMFAYGLFSGYYILSDDNHIYQVDNKFESYIKYGQAVTISLVMGLAFGLKIGADVFGL